MLRSRINLTIGAILLTVPSLAYADVVWPALYLEIRLFSWWAIGSGLIAEFFFVKWLFALPVKRAAYVTTVANAVSAVAGLLLIPIAGIAWEFFPGLLYMKVLKWGTFNPITWAATFLIACLINTAIESAVYRRAFKFSVRRREFGWLFLANAVSVSVAFVSLFVAPIHS